MEKMDLATFLFWIIALFTGLSALAVLLSQNIVRSAIWLLFTLAGTAGIFFLIGADFVAATQLIIYVGGILVLVVFGVMLTAQGPFISLKVGAAEWVIALTVGVLLLGVLTASITSQALGAHWSPTTVENLNNPARSGSSTTLGMAFLGVEEASPAIAGLPEGARPAGRDHVGYLLPFEIVSVHLLVVLIAAAYLARAKRRRGALA
jgi:NADH-quinone oxidoreductase subunit J